MTGGDPASTGRPQAGPESGRRTDPVLVVGAGPAGLAAAITLARYGVRVVLIDRREQTATLSRALVLSTRSMELLRSWGLEEQVRAGAADVEPLGWVTPTLASGVGKTYPTGHPTSSEAAQLSPTRPAWAPQDHTDPLLLELLGRLPAATVRLQTELVELSGDEHGVRACLRDLRTQRIEWLEAAYVVGADGAHSAVRASLGIGMQGPDALAEFHSAQFEADLRSAVGDRKYGLNVITNPESAGVLAPRGNRNRWGFSREWLPGQPRLVDMSRDALAAIIAAAIGIPTITLRIERTSSFRFAAQIAERYRSGRAFLCGDAAHRMTPRGGTGMNTALQDGFDLGWKLAWVLRGWASAGLLESYEAERRPVGLHNVERSARRDGAQQTAGEALPWDLTGRIPHHWLERDQRHVSTLDLLGDGFTLLASSRDPSWRPAVHQLKVAPPVVFHSVDQETSTALGLADGGAVLVRPDGQPVQRLATVASVAEAGLQPVDALLPAV